MNEIEEFRKQVLIKLTEAIGGSDYLFSYKLESETIYEDKYQAIWTSPDGLIRMSLFINDINDSNLPINISAIVKDSPYPIAITV